MKYILLAGAILLLAMACLPSVGEEPCACSDAVGQWDTTRVVMENGQPNAIEQLIPIREKMEIKEAGFCKLTGSFGNGGTITGTFLANSLQLGTDTNFGGAWSFGGKSGDANLKFYCEAGKGVTKFSGDMILEEENTRTEWRWEGKKAGTGCEDKSSENLVLVPGSTPPNCEWVCKDGYGRTSEDIVCRPCADICKGEIPDISKCVGGNCECINELKNALINALKGKDWIATAKTLTLYLKNDDKEIRKMAITGLVLCNKGHIWDKIPKEVDEIKKSEIRDRDLWIEVLKVK